MDFFLEKCPVDKMSIMYDQYAYLGILCHWNISSLNVTTGQFFVLSNYDVDSYIFIRFNSPIVTIAELCLRRCYKFREAFDGLVHEAQVVVSSAMAGSLLAC